MLRRPWPVTSRAAAAKALIRGREPVLGTQRPDVPALGTRFSNVNLTGP
jgi:hypothetical protein